MRQNTEWCYNVARVAIRGRTLAREDKARIGKRETTQRLPESLPIRLQYRERDKESQATINSAGDEGLIEGTPCDMKVSCTVWNGGKSGDNIKRFPIDNVSLKLT
jgi:hypothetical protein